MHTSVWKAKIRKISAKFSKQPLENAKVPSYLLVEENRKKDARDVILHMPRQGRVP